jgi:hypothetical protein
MARPKTSVNRLDNLNKFFVENKGKVLTSTAIENNVGASYWRACIRDLKAAGMNIESVREGRAVVGYKYTGGTAKTTAVAAKAVAKPAVKAKTETKELVAAKKAKTAKKPAKSKIAAKAEVTEETAGEDPEVLAILREAGLQ